MNRAWPRRGAFFTDTIKLNLCIGTAYLVLLVVLLVVPENVHAPALAAAGDGPAWCRGVVKQ